MWSVLLDVNTKCVLFLEDKNFDLLDIIKPYLLFMFIIWLYINYRQHNNFVAYKFKIHHDYVNKYCHLWRETLLSVFCSFHRIYAYCIYHFLKDVFHTLEEIKVILYFVVFLNCFTDFYFCTFFPCLIRVLLWKF